jgi:hypothetical protein
LAHSLLQGDPPVPEFGESGILPSALERPENLDSTLPRSKGMDDVKISFNRVSGMGADKTLRTLKFP